MKIYISGQITGLKFEEAKKKFIEASQFLLKNYHAYIVNPLDDFNYQKNKTWNEYMINDIKWLLECDTIFMLDNWQKSRGARIEHFIAKETGKVILYQDEKTKLKEKEMEIHYIKKLIQYVPSVNGRPPNYQKIDEYSCEFWEQKLKELS